jgi:hypothetical protein
MYIAVVLVPTIHSSDIECLTSIYLFAISFEYLPFSHRLAASVDKTCFRVLDELADDSLLVCSRRDQMPKESIGGASMSFRH